MAFLYDRTETETEVVIIYKYQVILYITLIFFALLSTMDWADSWGLIVWGPFTCILLAWLIGLRNPNSEIKRALKTGVVQISGSKLSLKNPLTVRIKK